MNLLQKAKKAPKPDTFSKHKWLQLCPVIVVLREKGYTYKEVSKWLTSEGVKCTSADVSQAYQRYIKEK